MKSTLLTPFNNNYFENRFKSLNNNEMINLRGGGDPPLPPTGGDDYPFDITKLSIPDSTNFTTKGKTRIL